MRKITFSVATQEAMREEMQRDKNVFLMGEDIARQGGIFGQFKGLADEFGKERVRDTPISETAIIGGGVGAALAGMRPVVDMHFADFIGVPMDEILNQMAKARYMFGGQAKVPLVLRAPDGMTRGGAAFPMSGSLVYAYSRYQGRYSFQPCRCERSAEIGYSQR